jgi:hypothetical protein
MDALLIKLWKVSLKPVAFLTALVIYPIVKFFGVHPEITLSEVYSDIEKEYYTT